MSIGAEDGSTVRVEGLIWNVRPVSGGSMVPADPESDTAGPNANGADSPIVGVRVTQRVLDQVVRAGNGQAQIVLKGFPGGTKQTRVRVLLEVEGDEYTLIVGDTHVAWGSHQDASSAQSFDSLFGSLADRPGLLVPVTRIGVVEEILFS